MVATSPDHPPATFAFDVRTYGAIGDGVTDDTGAFQSALTGCGRRHRLYPNRCLRHYRITLYVNSSLPMQLRGEGWSSNILRQGASDLLVFAPPNGDQPALLVLQDFAVLCVGAPKTGLTALRFTTGLVRSVISTLLFYGRGDIRGRALCCVATPSTSVL